MDFTIPQELVEATVRFDDFLKEEVLQNISGWYKEGAIPRSFFLSLGKGGWLGYSFQKGSLNKESAFSESMVMERLASLSPGLAVAILAHADLGVMGLWLFGSESLKKQYGKAVSRGETLMCLGNTEREAGSDVANVSARAEKVDGGWRINGSKAYVTNGTVADFAVITAVSDPEAPRNRRLSMFLVDLNADGVTKKKLNKQVWIPSDLTRHEFTDVLVPEENLLGEEGRGLQQVLTIFTHSRIPISALTLGTAVGAFELALVHAKKRKIFGQKLVDFQGKRFEISDLYAKMESVRLMILKACWARDQGKDFRLDSSLAKYLAVMTAREVTQWAADLFGAASVIFEHPIHKYPMDAWGSSLGEGTQDVQKLVIFRELMQRRRQ